MSDQQFVFSGFFNSDENGDRKYNATDFNKFFDGLICDGVYVNFPESENDPTEKAFYVKPGSGLQVAVAKGRAWFMGTYTYTESTITLNIDATANSLQSRIDAVVIDVNTGDDARINDIKIVKGTEATSPDRPSLIDQPTHKQFPIAFVTIPGGATSISQSNIIQCVGTDDPNAIPAVEALLEIASKSKKELQDQINAIKAPTFTEAETVVNINSGDNINTIWGKIKKMFSTIIAGLPISMGGTGATTKEAALTNLGIPQNVADAMSKQIYCSEDSNKSIVDLAHGGTGSNDGTINGVRVMKSGSTYGYVKEGETNVTPFRNPTGNAAAGDVLSGKTFANASSDSVSGTMANRGAVSQSLNCGGSYTVPAGYHNGSGKVTANSLASQTSATAAAGDIYTGKTAWVNGSKITGNMTNRGAVSQSLNSGGSYTIPAGYHNGSGKVTANKMSGTYTFPVNDTGGTKDMGDTNMNRYVNATNVYNRGNSDGHSSGLSDGHNDGTVGTIAISKNSNGTYALTIIDGFFAIRGPDMNLGTAYNIRLFYDHVAF